MRWLRSGLVRKFVLVMGALALVPVAILGYQLINISRRGIQAAVLELHTKLAEKLAEQVDDYFRVSNEKIGFALASLGKRMDWQDKQELLKSLIETHGDIVEISMVNAEGNEVLKVYNPDLTKEEALVSRVGEPGYHRFLKIRGRTMDVLPGHHGGAPRLCLYYPMSSAVMARIIVSLRRLSDMIEVESVGGTGFAVLIGEKGAPLLFPQKRLDAKMRGEFPALDIVKRALQSNTIGSSEFSDSSGAEYVGAYAPVFGIGNAVMIMQSRDEAYASAREMKRAAAWIVAGVVILCIVGAGFFARRLTDPLFTLTRAAEAVARGDFLAKVELTTNDELQDLGDTFNRMTAQLRSYSVLQVDKLIAEQRKTEAILYSIDDGILMTDKASRIQLANRRVREMFGVPSGTSLEGKTIDEALPASPLRDAVAKAAANPNPDSFSDVDLSTEEKHRYLRVLSQPVRTPGHGGNLGIVTAVRDVTLERELDKMKEEFLHYVTHDLRNPLGSAMGFLDVLLKGTAGLLNPDQQNIVGSIKRSSTRLMGMVNNILDIAKMDSGRIRLQLKPTALSGVASRSIAILESLARSKKIAVSLDAAEEFTVDADADLLERVFTNLLGNAIKYTPEGGAITLSIKDEGAHLKCGVSDTGDGIPPEFLEKIFMKFEQVTGQRKGGTGLGLTIAKFFVESHLGRIWVESEVGKGSQFYFTIPKTLALKPDGSVMAQEGVA
jgi:PAS domain S-box-containing protein